MNVRFEELRRIAEEWTHRIATLALRASLASLPARRIVQQFRDARVTTVWTARSFHPQSFVEQLEFMRLLRAGVIREPAPGRYYLDERTLLDVAA